MNIRIEIGNPHTEEWESGGEINLIPYQEVFSKTNPNLPPVPGFADQLAIENFEIDINNQSKVTVNAYFGISQNSMSIIVKHNGQSFVQVLGEALNSHGQGLSILFRAPDATVPVNLICQP